MPRPLFDLSQVASDRYVVVLARLGEILDIYSLAEEHTMSGSSEMEHAKG